MNGWKSISIGALVADGKASIRTGPFGTQLKAAEYVASGCPVINVRNVGLGSLTNAKLEFLDSATATRLSAHMLEADDIVFGRKGAVDRHLLVKNEAGWIQGSDCLRLRVDPNVISSRFLSYHLLRPEHRKWILAQSSHGSTMATLNQGIIERISLSAPSLDFQRRIASILGAYDDLIEVNRRRIAVLEAMARGLFEEWFVRFRFPGNSQCQIVDTPDGSTPNSWRWAPLSDVASVNARSLRPALTPETIGYIDIASVSPGQVDAISWMPFSEAPGRARRLVEDGSVIWSTVRPNRRSYALVLDPPADVVASTGFAVIDAKSVPFSYLYHAVTTDQFVGYLVGNATGSAYPAVTAKTFERARIIVPDEASLRAFDETVEPMLRLIANLRACNVGLAAARDLLLPRLISGELSVSAASRELEAAA